MVLLVSCSHCEKLVEFAFHVCPEVKNPLVASKRNTLADIFSNQQLRRKTLKARQLARKAERSNDLY